MAYNPHLPRDMYLLCLQHKHITKDLWKGNERVLRSRCTRIWLLNNKDLIDGRVETLIQEGGFGHILNLPDMDVNHLLLTALLERWR